MGRKKIPPPAPSAPALPDPPVDPRRRQLARVADKMASWRPAREVLRRVRAVPTIFPWLDKATKVNGWPVGRISVVHGPSSEGKTECVFGLGLSFLRAGHFFGYVDAEHTSPISWLETLFAGYADDPLFRALRPKSYEQTVDAVREMLKAIISLKETRQMPDAAALIAVDSIRKLVPEDFLAKIARYGAQGERGSVDGMSGMGAAIKARMNADWFDEVAPLLYRADASLLIVGRESANRDAGRGGPDWKLTGGRAVVFDTGGLLMRCERDWVRDGADRDAPVVGERHDVSIYKSKVAGKDDVVDVWSFHTSNGRLVPEGFDQARDLLELGVGLGVVQAAGSHYQFAKCKWQGKSRAVVRLSADDALRAELDRAVRAKFKTVATEGMAPIDVAKPQRERRA